MNPFAAKQTADSLKKPGLVWFGLVSVSFHHLIQRQEECKHQIMRTNYA